VAFIFVPGSDIAADSLRKFIKGKKVRVETYYIDDFNRQVARVFVNDTTDLSIWMLQKGYTWARTEPGQPKQEREYLADLQATAKDAKLGIWALPGRQLKPSTWRSKYSVFRNVVNWY
jgi:endonuclease YncB( thermonuclease family)